MMYKKTVIVVSIMTIFIGCGGGSSDNSSAYPEGFTIASPFANTTVSSTSVEVNTFNSSASFSQKSTTLTSVTNGTSMTDCQVSLPSIPAIGSPRAECYGPTLYYNDQHPNDGSAPAGSLPPGDLGIWLASEGSEACTAAQMNALINDIAARVDMGLLLGASMICITNVNGQGLPGVGGSLDLTSDLNTAIQVNNPTLTVTTATIERLNDSNSYAVYKYSIEYTLTDDIGTNSIKTYIKHIPTTGDNSTYKGKIWSSIDNTNTNTTYAYSILYEKDSTQIKTKSTSAYNDQQIVTTMLDSDGNFVMTGDWLHNLNYGIFNINTTTQLGAVSYSWQAGAGDTHARVLNVFTQQNGSVVDGCGFFGYGQKGDPTTGTYPTNTISTFICNWAGPGNDHTGLSSRAQKQCMEQDSSGNFVATTSNITYSPVNTCDSTAPFGIGSTSGTYDTSNITNDLIDITTDTDYANYTAPTAPADI